jgi:hypothetical protein
VQIIFPHQGEKGSNFRTSAYVSGDVGIALSHGSVLMVDKHPSPAPAIHACVGRVWTGWLR